MLDVASHGVAVIGSVTGGFPPIGLPQGITWSDVPKVLGIAVSCFVLIVAQSAATSRSFAIRHGQRVDVNRDILGLSGANFAAGLTGTFVVNGSPTKTEILDEQKGRTQVANMTMSAVVLLVVMFATGLLTNMPKAVLAAIVFLIGVGLIDVAGLQRIRSRRVSEFVIACVTGFVVFAVGVEQGIVLAVVLSILEIIRRAYRPRDFVVRGDQRGAPTFAAADARRRRACPAWSCSATTPSCSTPTPTGSPTTCRRSSTAPPTRSAGWCSTAPPSPTSTTRPASRWTT